MIYPETLAELLDKYIISVPIVQRDYVQGLNENIINELLDDIKNALNNKEQLRLNFIYGKVDGDLFIPLDGQQRLTTLFLLHLYAFRNMPEKDEFLKKFSYETRRSSREFLKHLCDGAKRKDVLNVSDTPSKAIKEALWFHSRWSFDPTIQSSLCCLDKIADKFHDVINLSELLESPTQKLVVFNFIPMTDMGMEDSLYIKLNARGRALTNFETYKADLLAKVENETSLPFTSNDFAIKLDTTWSDYFWGIGSDSFDEVYRRFFALIFGRIDRSSNKIREEISCETICEAYFTLNYIIINKGVISEYFKKCLLAQTLSYPERIIINSLSLFLGKAKGNVNQDELNDCYRIITNLTVNTTIERAEIYLAAHSALTTLSSHFFDLLDYFSSASSITLGGFSPDQVREERVKAKLIKHGYKKEIIDAESHKYFSGQIRSALNIAELKIEKVDSYDTSTIASCMKDFSNAWAKIAALFNDTAPRNGFLLRAALLSFGDYLPTSGQYLSLCVDRADEPTSLKALFTNGHKATIDLIASLTNATDQELESIVNKALTIVPTTDWKHWILKYPKETMGYLSSTYMRLCKSNDSHLLVSKYASSSHCKEIFTFALALELKNTGKNCQLPDEYGRDADYRAISGTNYIRYINGRFEITNSAGNISYISDIPAAVHLL